MQLGNDCQAFVQNPAFQTNLHNLEEVRSMEEEYFFQLHFVDICERYRIFRLTFTFVQISDSTLQVSTENSLK